MWLAWSVWLPGADDPVSATDPSPVPSLDGMGHPALPFRAVLDGRAALTVSIDLEMVWGVVHHGSTAPYLAYAARSRADERDVTRRLLTLCDRHDVPITWATVGHLMLEECPAPPPGGLKHPDHDRTFHPGENEDWFDLDPATSVADDPMFYAPDLVADIRAARTAHDVGSHGFSHLEVLPERVPRGAFERELELAEDAARRHDVVLRSFVYPRNAVAYTDALAEVGYRAYRVPPAWFDGHDGRVVVDASGTPVVGLDGGLGALRQTHFLRTPHVGDVAGGLRFRAQMLQMRRRLHQAVAASGTVHLWFHGHDLLPNPDLALAELGRLFALAARLRDRGDLVVATMDELASAVTVAAA